MSQCGRIFILHRVDIRSVNHALKFSHRICFICLKKKKKTRSDTQESNIHDNPTVLYTTYIFLTSGILKSILFIFCITVNFKFIIYICMDTLFISVDILFIFYFFFDVKLDDMFKYIFLVIGMICIVYNIDAVICHVF